MLSVAFYLLLWECRYAERSYVECRGAWILFSAIYYLVFTLQPLKIVSKKAKKQQPRESNSGTKQHTVQLLMLLGKIKLGIKVYGVDPYSEQNVF